jgi:hypothetical protein
MKMMIVKAAHADRPCPKIRKQRLISSTTGRDRTMIYADTPVEVPDVLYYRRRVLKGDLVIVTELITKTVVQPAAIEETDNSPAKPAPKKKGKE